MARTIRILGGGPLVGKTFYGELVAARKRAAEVELDVLVPFGRVPLLFDTETGALVVNESDQTDLLRVDAADLPRFQEQHLLMRGV